MTDSEHGSDRLEELRHELELLRHEAESLRTFFSLTAIPRKEYTEQMARAEATRTREDAIARADGILARLKAEAEGLRLVGEVLSQAGNPSALLAFAKLQALERIAHVIANGRATKLFLPRKFGQILSYLDAVALTDKTDAESPSVVAPTEPPTA